MTRIVREAVARSTSGQRGGARGNVTMPFPFVIPHQDGAGIIDAVGSGVDAARVGERVWVYEATLGRFWGTAAQYSVVPAHKAVKLPEVVARFQVDAIEPAAQGSQSLGRFLAQDLSGWQKVVSAQNIKVDAV